MIIVKLIKKNFFLEESDFQSLNSKGFGTNNGKIYELSIFEVLYLLEKDKIKVINKNQEKVKFETIVKKLDSKLDYIVYKDLKSKGYNIQSGVKFGFRFRIYDKGIKIGDDHSLWLVEPISELKTIKISELVGKIRIANTTKKKMLLAVVDTDLNVSYFEQSWKRT